MAWLVARCCCLLLHYYVVAVSYCCGNRNARPQLPVSRLSLFRSPPLIITMVLSSLHSPDAAKGKETSLTHHLFWKNKGIQSTSFNYYVPSDAEDEEMVKQAPVGRLTTKGASKSTTMGARSKGKTLNQWSVAYPSLVMCFKFRMGNKNWNNKKAKTKSQLSWTKKDNHNATESPGSEASSESSPTKNDKDFWTVQLGKLHNLIEANQIQDARRKFVLSERSKELAQWLEVQVGLARRGKLEYSQLCALVDLGLSCEEEETSWNLNYQSLEKMVKSEAFELAIDFILGVNAIVIAIQTFPELSNTKVSLDTKYWDGSIGA